MNATERQRILVINDDTAFLQLMAQLLEDEGYQAEALRSTTNAIDQIKDRPPALIILDLRINNEESGLVLLDLITLEPETRSIPVVIASANLQPLAGRTDELAENGIYLIAKPFDIDALGALIRTALCTG